MNEVDIVVVAVSQTEACDAIRGMGQVVVGWYHSHPTFAPNPSVRDLETQHKFQVALYHYPRTLRLTVRPKDAITLKHNVVSIFKCCYKCKALF